MLQYYILYYTCVILVLPVDELIRDIFVQKLVYENCVFKNSSQYNKTNNLKGRYRYAYKYIINAQ